MLNGDNHTLSAAPFQEHTGEHAREIAGSQGTVGTTYGQVKERLQQAVDLLLDGQRMLRSLTGAGVADPPSPPVISGEYPAPPVSDGGFGPELPAAAPVHRPAASPHDPSAPALLQIYTLGRLQVCRGDREISTWRSNRAKGILRLLLANLGRPVPKEVIMDALWPDSPVESAAVSLRVAVHELRQTLDCLGDDSYGARCIIVRDGKYRLNADLPIWIDVEQFEAHWRAGQTLEKAARPLGAIAEYQRAERLYQGDFLEMDPYDDAALIRREGLIDIYLSILSKVAEHHFFAADYESCTELSRRILVKDQCREDAYQRLIGCCLKLGQRSRALRWYQICQETLRRELDCAVSPQTLALYHSLIARDSSTRK